MHADVVLEHHPSAIDSAGACLLCLSNPIQKYRYPLRLFLPHSRIPLPLQSCDPSCAQLHGVQVWAFKPLACLVQSLTIRGGCALRLLHLSIIEPRIGRQSLLSFQHSMIEQQSHLNQDLLLTSLKRDYPSVWGKSLTLSQSRQIFNLKSTVRIAPQRPSVIIASLWSLLSRLLCSQ